MSLMGVDVSVHNGKINWDLAKKKISFAMLRAGYSRTIDSRFKFNLTECQANGIPIGVYWFSYALNTEYAKKEAAACLSALNGAKLDLPIFFDYEYDSYNYSVKNGVKPSGQSIRDITVAFCEYIKKNSNYQVGIYTNVDYINLAYKPLLNSYPIWLAQWSTKKSYSCLIWQKSSTGSVDGINGNVDINILYGEVDSTNSYNIDSAKVKSVCEKYDTLYKNTALEVLNGKYGNGKVRKAALQEKGMDYDFVQAIVNALLE